MRPRDEKPGLQKTRLSGIPSGMQRQNTRPLFPKWLAQVAGLLGWTLIFSIAYAQSPLYTSNQNQYFLHGLARAGFGSLHRDWLANTLDPTPVFSALVAFTYRFTHLETLFYAYYALLMGVYAFSLLGIVEASVWSNSLTWRSPDHRKETHVSAEAQISAQNLRLRRLVFLSLLVVIHSAGLRFALSRSLGANWAYVLEDGVADQRLLGPVLQPSAFGVFLLLSIVLFLRRRPYLAVLAAVLAASIHPTYLLSAGVLTGAYLAVILLEKRSPGKTARVGGFALLAVAPIVVYVYRSFGGVSPEVTARAQAILVHYRIPHHALIAEWFDATVVVKLLLVAAALVASRRTRLFPLLLLASLAAAGLTILQALTGSDRLALLFPWRLSTFLVPLSTAVLLARLAGWLTARPHQSTAASAPGFPVQSGSRAATPISERALLIASLAILSLAVLVGGLRFFLDLQRKASSAERPLERWVSAHRQPTNLYLTPVKLQDFRLATGAPVFIEFKSIPYQETDVLEWHRRIQTVDAFYKQPDCERLTDLASQEGITHAILEEASAGLECPFFKEEYRDAAYRLVAIQGSQP